MENRQTLYGCSVEFDSNGFVFLTGSKDLAERPDIILGRREMSIYKNMNFSSTYPAHWLSGRLAAKLGLMEFLKKESGHVFDPTEIEILPDESGRPIIGGLVRKKIHQLPMVSISHTKSAAVAMIGFAASGIGPGIDMEHVDRKLGPRVTDKTFSSHELDMLPKETGQTDQWKLRFWCAKEAASKAIRSGIVDQTGKFEIIDADHATGQVTVSVSEELFKDKDRINPINILIHTFCLNNFIIGKTANPEQ